MASKVVFSGPTKQIIVNNGVTEIDVKTDLYSEWKRWAIEENNLGYLQAFRTFGGDPTITGQFAPAYFFLTNGWRVIVDNGDEVSVGVNLYTDELNSPFIVGNSSAVSLRNSDAVTVDNGVSQNLDYGGEIQVNSITGLAGTIYPAGTLAQPVNNISDALIIANQLGIARLKVYGNVTIDQNLTNFSVIGGNFNSSVNLMGVNLEGTSFEKCILNGSYFGKIRVDECEINDGFTGLEGKFNNCGINGDLYAISGISSYFSECYTNSVLESGIHMNIDSVVRYRGYTGGVDIYDCQSGSVLSISFAVGQAYILTGNTSGDITLLGIASFDNQSSGTTVNTTSLLVPYDIATQHLLNVNTEILKNK
jgi:hypothetical protein